MLGEAGVLGGPGLLDVRGIDPEEAFGEFAEGAGVVLLGMEDALALVLAEDAACDE